MIRKTITFFTLIIFLTLSPALGVFAGSGVDFQPSSTPANQVGGCDGTAANSPVCTDLKSTENPIFGPTGITTKVAGIFGLITGIIAVFMLILSGLRYVMSGGDPAKTATARNGILYSAIGVAVAVVAGTLVRFILSKL